ALGHHMSIDQKVIFPVHLVQCKSVYTQPFLLRTRKSAKPPQQQQQGVSVVVSGAPQNFGTMRPVSNLGAPYNPSFQQNTPPQYAAGPQYQSQPPSQFNTLTKSQVNQFNPTPQPFAGPPSGYATPPQNNGYAPPPQGGYMAQPAYGTPQANQYANTTGHVNQAPTVYGNPGSYTTPPPYQAPPAQYSNSQPAYNQPATTPRYPPNYPPATTSPGQQEKGTNEAGPVYHNIAEQRGFPPVPPRRTTDSSGTGSDAEQPKGGSLSYPDLFAGGVAPFSFNFPQIPKTDPTPKRSSLEIDLGE
ncbi:hypothetical protein PROFUN_16248, partial [Planoprotostelium fungivorum]